MNNLYDVVIIGGGPAGLSAAIYMARAQFSVLVIEKESIGGQIQITSEIVNYPGVKPMSGKELTEQMRKQAQSYGAEFLIAEVTQTKLEGDLKYISTNRGDFQSVGVILATGANPRKLGFVGESEFQGRGVAYCATCDGEFFTDLDVFVIGGGFAAAEEAIFLTKYARKVHIIVREEDFLCAKSIANEVKEHEKIEVTYQTEIVEAGGDSHLQYAIFKNNATGEKWRYDATNNETFGVFVFAGYVPATSLFKDQVETTQSGYFITDEDQKTNIDGVYAAGDACVKNLRQVVTAVSDGAIAATSLEKHVPTIVDKLQLSTKKPVQSKVEETVEISSNDENFITADMKAQLLPIMEKLTQSLIIKCNFKEDSLSQEMNSFIQEFSQLSNFIEYKLVDDGDVPSMAFYNDEDSYLGVTYHMVPGGHEFNSFVLAVYNAVGPKQSIDEEVLASIQEIQNPISLKVMVSLSCTMCPDVVQGSQRIALENKNVKTEIFDLAYFPKLKEEYNIMSVPCLIINDDKVVFGKKDISQITELIQN